MSFMIKNIIQLNSVIKNIFNANVPIQGQTAPQYIVTSVRRRLRDFNTINGINEKYAIEKCISIPSNNPDMFLVLIDDTDAKYIWDPYVDMTICYPPCKNIYVASLSESILNRTLDDLVGDLYRLYMQMLQFDTDLTYEPGGDTMLSSMGTESENVPSYDSELYYIVIYLLYHLYTDIDSSGFVSVNDSKLPAQLENILRNEGYPDEYINVINSIMVKTNGMTLEEVFSEGGFIAYTL